MIRKYGITGLLGCCLAFSQSAMALEIVINPFEGFNSAALPAFERAAAQWESRVFDPITVTIDTNFDDLGSPSVIGNASSVQLTFTGSDSYTAIRDLMV